MKLRLATITLALVGLAAAPLAGTAAAEPGTMSNAVVSRAVGTSADGRDVCEVTIWGQSKVVFCTGDMVVQWNADGSRPEYFAIAPNREIWHVWPGHGWAEMPHEGRADAMHNAQWDANGNRYVWVAVWGSGFYRSADPAGPASWTPWQRV